MDLQEKLEKFLREYYHPELVKSLKEERSLTVDFSHIDRYDAILADELLENPERDVWQKPELLLDALEIKKGSVVADIGAGSGYLVLKLLKRT